MLVNPIVSNMSSSIQNIQQSTNYDITQAYNTYKSQQLGIAANAQVATSVKERASTALSSAFKTGYEATKQTMMSDVSDVYSEYSTDINKIYEETSTNLESITNAIMGFGDITYADNPNWADALYDVDDSGTYNLSTQGRQNIDELLNKYFNEEGFDYYLRNSLKDSKLADWYSENSSLVRELVGGLDPDDYSFTSDDAMRTQAEETKAQAKEVLGDEFEEKDFDSFAEEQEYYTEQVTEYEKAQYEKERLNNIETSAVDITNSSTKADGSLSINVKNSIITTSDNTKYKPTGYNIGVKKDIGADKLGIKEIMNTLRPGDIVKGRDSNLYLVTFSSNNKDYGWSTNLIELVKQ